MNSLKNDVMTKSSELQNLQVQLSKKEEALNNLKVANNHIAESFDDKMRNTAMTNDESMMAIGENNVMILKLQEENSVLQKEKNLAFIDLEKLREINKNTSELNDQILHEKHELLKKYDELLLNYKDLQEENENLKIDLEEGKSYV